MSDGIFVLRRCLASAVAILAMVAAGCRTGESSASPAPRGATVEQANSTTSTAASADTSTSHPARINHIVLFKLKDAADAPALLEACDRLVPAIPGVRSYFAGAHLDTGRGERVESNYDLGMYVGFDTEHAYAQYVEHPNHVALVQTWGPRLEWYRVWDIEDATP